MRSTNPLRSELTSFSRLVPIWSYPHCPFLLSLVLSEGGKKFAILLFLYSLLHSSWEYCSSFTPNGSSSRLLRRVLWSWRKSLMKLSIPSTTMILMGYIGPLVLGSVHNVQSTWVKPLLSDLFCTFSHWNPKTKMEIPSIGPNLKCMKMISISTERWFPNLDDAYSTIILLQKIISPCSWWPAPAKCITFSSY